VELCVGLARRALENSSLVPTPATHQNVEGCLSRIAPASGRVQVTALVARLGGAIVGEGSETAGAAIDILLLCARYDELARGLAQLGRWSASNLAGDADPSASSCALWTGTFRRRSCLTERMESNRSFGGNP